MAFDIANDPINSNGVRFILDPTSGADGETWGSFFQTGMRNWTITAITTDGTQHLMCVAETLAGWDDDGPYEGIFLVGHAWDEEEGAYRDGTERERLIDGKWKILPPLPPIVVTVPWSDIHTIIIH
mgnify:FL=1